MIGPTRAADGARDRTEVLWFDPAAGAKGRIVESKNCRPGRTCGYGALVSPQE